MGEENDDKLEAEGTNPKKKKGKRLILIIVIAVVFLLLGGGVFLFFTKTGGDKAVKKGEVTAKEESVMFSLDPFVVNLSDQGATKFLKVVIQLELSNKDVLDTSRVKAPQIRDAIISILSSHSSVGLMQPEGKLQLKDEINLTGNQILGKDAVKNVYFTDFVMQ